MRGYDWGKGIVRCGFCGGGGHNITTCSRVDSTVKSALSKLEDDSGVYRLTRREVFALKEMKKREARKEKMKNAKRRKPRCSFCNSTKHKRNKCPKRAKFMKRVRVANSNWRRAFVSQMNSQGYGIGSLVEVPMALIASNSVGHVNGLIVGYNKKNLNMFCTIVDGGDYYAEPSIEILCEGEVINSCLHRLVGNFDSAIVGRRYSWNHYKVTSLCRSVSSVGDEFYQSDDDIWEWFSKKISTKDRLFHKVEELVKRWQE